jgi:hypothetical protein
MVIAENSVLSGKYTGRKGAPKPLSCIIAGILVVLMKTFAAQNVIT